jgi:hypothetical protein
LCTTQDKRRDRQEGRTLEMPELIYFEADLSGEWLQFLRLATNMLLTPSLCSSFHLAINMLSTPNIWVDIVPDSSFRMSIASSTAPRYCILPPLWTHDLRLSLSTGGVASRSSCKSAALRRSDCVRGTWCVCVDTWVQTLAAQCINLNSFKGFVLYQS